MVTAEEIAGVGVFADLGIRRAIAFVHQYLQAALEARTTPAAASS